jgi:DNA-directed RNA polymerase subunit omega
MLPSPDILNDFQPGKFVLSNLAAKRAKQLREGAPPLVQIESNHPLTIALAEIAAGKIKAIMPSADAEAFEVPEATVLVEETVPGELGMLLPALDETETALVGSGMGEDEHEADTEDHDPDSMSLSDLVGEEEEHEEAAATAEDDTLSLSDIAEQESQEEEEAE